MGAIYWMRMVKCNIITLSFRKLKINSTKCIIKMKMIKFQVNIKNQSLLILKIWRRVSLSLFKNKCMINFFKICQLQMQTSITLNKVSFYRFVIWHCWMRLRGLKMIIEKRLLESLSDIKMDIGTQSLRLIHKNLI